MHALDSIARDALALRPRKAAEALGVSERTLWTWTKAGDVPHTKLGGVVLYPVAELRDWLSRKSARPIGAVAANAGEATP